MAKNRKNSKTYAKNIFFFKQKGTYTYEIGILDNEYKYYYFQLHLQTDTLTFVCARKLNYVFSKFLITSETDIMYVEDEITKKTPIYIYFNILNQNVFANFRKTTFDNVAKKISTFNPTYLNKKKPSKVTKYSLDKLWSKIVEFDRCPWINKHVDSLLLLKSAKKMKILRILMMGLYFQTIKIHMNTRAAKYTKQILPNANLSSTI